VLRGADGVVFVADSALTRVDDDKESWRTMRIHLWSFGINPDKLPTVVQLNKQDLPNSLNAPTMKYLLNINGLPIVEAIATQGQGILETLRIITREVITQVQKELL
jgi:signal recognition particle receptor subunit beta